MDDGTKVSPRKAVVIGAGIAGISSALYLQRDGHAVTVLDPEPPGSMTSYGNAGLIATQAIVALDFPLAIAVSAIMLSTLMLLL